MKLLYRASFVWYVLLLVLYSAAMPRTVCAATTTQQSASEQIQQESKDVGKPGFFGKLLLRAMTSTLHEAAQTGQVDKVRQLIAKGEDVNGLDKHQTTPLFWAALSQDQDVAKVLVAAGANINAVGPNGTTPLYNALHKNNTPLALWLIEQGANVHACDANGNTMLHLAAMFTNKEVAKVLLEKGLDVNAISAKGFSPLALSVLLAQNAKLPILSPDFVFLMLEAGAQYKPLPGLDISLEEAMPKLCDEFLLQESLTNYSENAVNADVREFAKKIQGLTFKKTGNSYEDDASRPESIQSSVLGTMSWKEYFWESSPVAIPFYNNELVAITYDFDPQDDPDFLKEADAAMQAFLAKTTAERLQLSPQVANWAIMNIENTDFSNYDINDEGSWYGFRDTSINSAWLEAFVAGKKDVQHVWNMVGKPREVLVGRPKPGAPVYVAIVWACVWDIEHQFQLSFEEGKELARMSIADGNLVD